MNLAVIGLGYVGCVTMACLADYGHTVIGVDINNEKVQAVRAGKSPITEPGLDSMISEGIERRLIKATQDVRYAVDHADIVFVCVGTPSKHNGGLELSYVERVCNEIGSSIADRNRYIAIAIRSTILPGCGEHQLIPIIERQAGKQVGTGFGFCINPEFLREGSAIADFKYPPFTLIGQSDEKCGEVISQVYKDIDAPIYRLPLGTAEMVKYASNAFHALKVCFANEIGIVCQSYGLDSHLVMNIFTQDINLNISPSYLMPGFAFGGSCLGKDLRALLQTARINGLDIPVLESILPSNQLQIERALEILINEGTKRIGMIGLSFKVGTDDLRESPSVELAERLIGKGFELSIYDHDISLNRLHGSNREYIELTLPHIHSLMRPTLDSTIDGADVIIVTKKISVNDTKRLIELMRTDQILIDLIRLDEKEVKELKGQYRGISW